MRTILRLYLKALLPLALFLGAQGVASLVVVAGGGLALALLVANLLALGSVLWFCPKKAPGVSREGENGSFWKSFLAGLLAIFACNLLSEQFALPDLMEEQFLALARSPLAWIAIGLVGPVAEEVVFRFGVQGTLQAGGQRTWVAIVVSAAVFGLIHLNPAQVPFAFLMGLVLSIIYYQTGSLLAPCLLHIANNSLSLLLMARLGEAARTFSLTQAVGGEPVAWALIVLCGAGCVFLLKRRHVRD